MWLMVALVRIAEPLEGRDTDHSIECSGSKSKSIPHVPKKEVTLYFTLLCHRWRGERERERERAEIMSIYSRPLPSILLLMSTPTQ